MTFRSLAAVCGIAFSSLLFVVSGSAQGVIIPIVCDQRPCRPRPMPRPLPNALPVKSIQLDTKINGQVATTHVEQVFRNDTQYTLEGTYFFPIPETASIVEFAIWENGKKLVGEVRSREEARRIYDEIVRRQKDPGLLEYAGKDLFQASIFPIPPNSDKKLELTYTEILKAESGTVAYRYPLGNRQKCLVAADADGGCGDQWPGETRFWRTAEIWDCVGNCRDCRQRSAAKYLFSDASDRRQNERRDRRECLI